MVGDSLQNSRVVDLDRQWADSLRSLPEYQYVDSGTSLLSTIKDWFWSLIMEVLDGRGDSAVDYIGYALIIAVIVIAVRLLLRGGASSPLEMSRRGSVLELDEELADTKDYDRLIGAAVASQHYREAVRLLYRRSLSNLQDDGLIDWRPEKTDSEYVREVRGKWAGSDAFALAVREFQWVWFGEREINESEYLRIRNSFDALLGRGQ